MQLSYNCFGKRQTAKPAGLEVPAVQYRHHRINRTGLSLAHRNFPLLLSSI